MATPTSSWSQLVTIWWLSPYVMASRMSAFPSALEPATMQQQAEMQRMVTEKAFASAESIIGLQFAAWKTAFGFWAAQSQTPYPVMKQGLAFSDTMTKAALRPYAKRVKANAKRLSR